MKNPILLWIALLSTGAAMAQTDSTSSKSDTIRIGGMLIIKRKGPNVNSKNSSEVTWTHRRTKVSHQNVETNYLIMDLGFSNFTDNSDYSSAAVKNYARVTRVGEQPFSASDFNRNNGKSVNFNIWFFMQRRNLIGHVLNLKYGLGLETNNYRFDNNISFKKGSAPYVFRDSISFSKNKLALDYVTVPLMLNVNTNPHANHPFVFSGGVSLGYLYSSRNKQISSERGKQTNRGDFDFKPFKISYVGEIGLGALKIYGSYTPQTVFKNSTGMDIKPYNIGLRFGGWD